MTRRISVLLSLCLLLATSAWAQLASQTALVGTVTDSGGLVVPGAQVVAVNTGTKDTYEATTNTEGYYHIPFVRPGRYEITITIPSFQTFKTVGVEVATNQVVRTNATLQVGGVSESVNVSAEAQVIDTDRATVSETIGAARDRRAAVERAQRLESGEHDARGARRPEQRYRPELPRRGPAGDSEQPVARRHQLLVQSAGGDQHAADRRCGDGDPGPDRQHLGRVRRLPRRPHQRRDQERHQRAAWIRVRVLPGRGARCARLLREHGAAQESAGAQPVRGADGRPGRDPRTL